MTLLETLLISLGPAIGKAVVRVWLKDSPFGSEMGSSLIDLFKNKTDNVLAQRSAERQISAIADGISSNLHELFRVEGVSLEESSRLAIANAVAEVFNGSSIDSDLIVQMRSEPTALANFLLTSNPRVAIHFSASEEEFLRRLLLEACRYVIDIASQLPSHTERNFTAILLQTDLILSRANTILDEFRRIREESQNANSGPSTARFEEDYRLAVVHNLDILQLFGAQVDTASKRHQLSVAYIPLTARKAVRSNSQDPQESATDEPGPTQNEDGLEFVTIDQALLEQQKVVIRGHAGSGKTTLLQWLAVRSASGTFEGSLSEWNDTIPFFIKLRQFVEDRLRLPSPDRFPQMVAPFVGATPEGWVESKLSSGKALLLIDGVDEVPSQQRNDLRAWIAALVAAYPDVRVIITSRPHALDDMDLHLLGCNELDLQPMEIYDINLFIDHWHNAVRGVLPEAEEAAELHALAQNLKRELRRNRPLRLLATSPLLCSMLCALHRHRVRHIPVDRIELYDACIDMLLERREAARGIDLRDYPDLTLRQKHRVLEDLAYWMMFNSWSEVKLTEVEKRVSALLPTLDRSLEAVSGESVRRLLTERTGVVREPTAGYMDFTHRTFQEFLTAYAIVYERDFGFLLQHAADDQWRNVVILAVGLASRDDKHDLIVGLIDAGDASEVQRQKMHLLALASLETSLDLTPTLRAEVQSRAEALVPPKNITEAKDLASAGELVVPFLSRYTSSRASVAAACIRTLALIGGDAALDSMEAYSKDSRQTVVNELVRDWDYFERSPEYATRILAKVVQTQRTITLERVPTLDFLRHATGVTTLQVRNLSQISDLSPLAELQELTTLELSGGNEVRDLGALAHLSKLQSLRLNGLESVRDLSPLAELQELTTLELSGGHDVRDVGFLAHLGKLQSLRLFHLDRVRDLSPLAELQELRFLSINGFPMLSDLDVIASLRSLKSLSIYTVGNIVSLAPLSRLEELEDLVLGGFHHSYSFRFVDPLHRYQALELNGSSLRPERGFNAVNDLEPLSRLKRLDTLTLVGFNSVKDLSPLATMSNLLFLTLEGFNLVTTLEPLSDLKSVRSLILAGFDNVESLNGIEGRYYDMVSLLGFKAIAQEHGAPLLAWRGTQFKLDESLYKSASRSLFGRRRFGRDEQIPGYVIEHGTQM